MATLQDAEALFAQKNYYDAFNASFDITQAEPDNYDAWLLMGKSFLLMTNYKNWSENRADAVKALIHAEKRTKDMEELKEFNFQVRCATRMWIADQKLLLLENVRQQEDLDAWGDYLKQSMTLEITMGMFRNTLRRCPHSTELREAAGLSAQELDELCNDDRQEQIDKLDDDLNILVADRMYEISCDIYEKAKNLLENNNVSDKELVRQIGNAVIPKLGLARLMASLSGEREGTPTAIKVRALKKQAEIEDYELEAKLYPCGVPMHLYQGDRSKNIAELTELYEQIKTLEPSFTAPPLPPVMATKLPTTPAASSGGCYVATAVYGSYDCPEVWTLRRFRDDTLAEHWYGRTFIHLYYAVSPTLVRWFGETRWFKALWRGKLDRMVSRLNERGVENTPYQDKKW